MNICKTEENIRKLADNFNEATFIYDLLLAYGKPKASITRLQKSYNLSKRNNEVIWKKNLCFRRVNENDLYSEIDTLNNDSNILKHSPRFIIVTDYKKILATDTKTKDTLDISFNELGDNFDFFLPWAGFEKTRSKTESLADIRAAEQMAKLYDEIKKDNPWAEKKTIHSLNVFLSRLLFCFFAEDTTIFEKGLFSSSIASHTLEDGSDLNGYLDRLFEALNSENKSRFPKYLQIFPYVNGGLFAEKHPVPRFTRRSRKILLECGGLNWSSINPDIFGSMIQAVVDSNQRGEMGMHYTSVPNIMKVIEPLFLSELYNEFERSKGNQKKLEKLLVRLSQIKIFDPACGSGNFLIVAYKELRSLEMKIIKHLQGFTTRLPLSNIKLSQFYGIEIDDFAHEVAMLSLWLIDHQMNQSFKIAFDRTRPSLPLKQGGHIICGNATLLDWEKVCPKDKESEIFILGNPPYLGARMQSREQKEDISFVFQNYEKVKKIDYISCWFLKASEYIQNSHNRYAFVSTNSICQGEQVSMLWPHIFKHNLEIYFAHQSFKWSNNAKRNAGVICVIIGLRNISNGPKYIFKDATSQTVSNISSYLTNKTNNLSVLRKSAPISNIPKMEYGNMVIDGGHLIISKEMRNSILDIHPEVRRLIRRVVGAQEFVKGIERWCLWIEDKDLEFAENFKVIKDKIKAVKTFRLGSSDVGTRLLANRPHQFREMKKARSCSIIVPTVTSERREYIPIGFLKSSEVIIAPNNAIYDAEPYVFGIISSHMHMVWVRAVAGRLKTDYRYSSALCYNTFPFPTISNHQKQNIHNHVLNILSEREKHSGKVIAELYDPDKMPKGLREAHRNLDTAIDRCYRLKPFEGDEERLEYLFKLYEEMTQNEKKRKNHA